jgi:hypothetical protein
MYAQGQTHSKSTAEPAKTAAASGLSVDDVIKMSKAGLDSGIIVQQIRKNGKAFDLTTDQLIQLKTSGVSDRVVAVMMDPSKPDAAPVAAPAPVLAAADLSLTELGVYAKKQGDWIEVLPEIVNWKTGGVLKNIASAGLVKGDVNGHIEGPVSKTGLTTPIEIRIVLPEGVAITEYQFVHLHQNACDTAKGDTTNLKNTLTDCGNREFRITTGGVMHVKSGATRDLVPFDGKRISGRAYAVTFPSNLEAGEYGFVPPGAIDSTRAGKIYSFRVIE